MPVELSIEEQLDLVRGTLSLTLAGKIKWQETGESGTYRSTRDTAVAVLDRAGSGPHTRVRLRFSPPGQTSFDTDIKQLLSDGDVFREELDLDALLEYLYSRVDRQSERHRNSGTRFVEQP
jgi:hypothetical protein